ncbi:MAG: FtsH protease activity modulator HflK [Saccharofermentans sp.]|nr:FtsH protease activity modulator HflK [Saccharofermentans sp.]
MANIKTIPNEATLKMYNRIKKFALAAVIVLGVLICVFRCFYSVDEQHSAIVTQFGSIVKVNTAGFYLKAPWQSVNKVDMTTHGTGIGYTVSTNGQNIVDTDNGIMITSDFNLLNIDFYLEYRVSDPVEYVYASQNPEMTLSNITMANIRTIVSNYTVDEAMTTAKGQIQADVKAAILNELEMTDIGLTVVNITIQDSEPPTPEIIAAFKSVENAKQGADTAMNKALEYKNNEIPNSQATADSIIQAAEADKAARIAEANGQVERFNKIYEEYKQFPYVTKRRLFYEKLESVLPNCKVIITDGSTSTVYPLDSFTNVNPNYTEPASGNDVKGGN